MYNSQAAVDSADLGADLQCQSERLRGRQYLSGKGKRGLRSGAELLFLSRCCGGLSSGDTAECAEHDTAETAVLYSGCVYAVRFAVRAFDLRISLSLWSDSGTAVWDIGAENRQKQDHEKHDVDQIWNFCGFCGNDPGMVRCRKRLFSAGILQIYLSGGDAGGRYSSASGQ